MNWTKLPHITFVLTLLVVEPFLHIRLQAQSYIRTFDFSYTRNGCVKLRTNPSRSISDCRLEGQRTTKLSLYSNGTFAVEREDRTSSKSTVTIIEGMYEKLDDELVFFSERRIDAAGQLHFVESTDRVLYEDRGGRLYLIGGEAILWGVGASEREGLFE